MNFLLGSVLNNNLYTIDNDDNNLRRIKQQTNIRESSYQDDNETNPYLYILNKLSSNEGTAIKPRDLAYLKDLGVQPVNRMFVLRRWDSGNIKGPNVDLWSDPNYKNKKPVSVIVGWIPEDENLFDISVKEGWRKETNLIHKLIGKILKEFDLKGEKMTTVPGWSQGLMVKLLQKIGGDNISTNKIMEYFGNPDVLQEGATRTTDYEYNLGSSINFRLKTTYEAKYIYDVDPVDAMKSIVDNLLSMGSSPEVHFNISSLTDVAKKIATSEPSEGWKEMKNIIKKFLNGIKEMISAATEMGSDDLLAGESKDENGENNDDNDDNDDNDNSPEEETKTRTNAREKKFIPEKAAKEEISKKAKAAYQSASLQSELVNKVLENDFMQDIYAVTIAKYRHNFRGTWGLHTGENTTPWHLTIGNPLSPVLSLNNIIVTNVSIKGKNNFTYNDIPEEIEATINISESRNMGIQKISEMFFRKHIRTYASTELLDRTIANKNPVYVGNYWENIPNEEKYQAMSEGIDGLSNTPDTTNNKDEKTSSNKRIK